MSNVHRLSAHRSQIGELDVFQNLSFSPMDAGRRRDRCAYLPEKRAPLRKLEAHLDKFAQFSVDIRYHRPVG